MFRKLLKAVSSKSEIISSVFGILLIISLVFVYRNPHNKYAIIMACCAGGLVNIMSGLKYLKDPVRRMTGLTFCMMGIIIMFLGYIITQYLLK